LIASYSPHILSQTKRYQKKVLKYKTNDSKKSSTDDRNPDTEIILNHQQLSNLCECDQEYSGDGIIDSDDVHGMMSIEQLDPILGIVTTIPAPRPCDVNGDGESNFADQTLASQILAVFNGGSFLCRDLPQSMHCRSPIAGTQHGPKWIDGVTFARYAAGARNIFVGHPNLVLDGAGETELLIAPVSQRTDWPYFGAISFGGYPYSDLLFIDQLAEDDQRLIGEWQPVASYELPFSTWGPNDFDMIQVHEHIAQCDSDLALKLVPTCKVQMPGTNQVFDMRGAPQYAIFLYGDELENNPENVQCQ
jgi:hypothetical protein